MGEQVKSHHNLPLFPDEVDIVHRVFVRARQLTKVSRYDIKAERLAAMAIRFYQLGIRDEGALLAHVVNAHCELNGIPLMASAPDNPASQADQHQ
jgi:hypothetical protein